MVVGRSLLLTCRSKPCWRGGGGNGREVPLSIVGRGCLEQGWVGGGIASALGTQSPWEILHGCSHLCNASLISHISLFENLDLRLTGKSYNRIQWIDLCWRVGLFHMHLASKASNCILDWRTDFTYIAINCTIGVTPFTSVDFSGVASDVHRFKWCKKNLSWLL